MAAISPASGGKYGQISNSRRAGAEKQYSAKSTTCKPVLDTYPNLYVATSPLTFRCISGILIAWREVHRSVSSETETGKIQYHEGFYAAFMAEYETRADMMYWKDHELGEKPVRADLVVTKGSAEPLTDPIGSFFRKYNVAEYKSPEDGLTIDDFDKTHGYAYLFKSASPETKFEEMTVSIFRHGYPREMVKALQKRGFDVEQSFPGIYYVTSRTSLPTQLVVISQLAEGTYPGMKILAKNARMEDVKQFLGSITNNRHMIEYATAILQVSIAANQELFEKMKKEDSVMNAAVERLFAKEINVKWNDGWNDGWNNGWNDGWSDGWSDGHDKGCVEGERNATNLMNYLWTHGRGEEAQKASSDKDLFNKLLAEFQKAVSSATF